MDYALLSDTFPKARKEHQCIWCGEKILTGEKYRREISVYCQEIQDQAWHLECVEDCRALNGMEDFEIYPGENERPEERLGFQEVNL